MHIEITIHCPELAMLANALQAKTVPAPSESPAAVSALSAPQVTTAPTPVPVTVSAPPPVTAAPTAAPQYTLEQIMKAGAGLVQAGKMEQISTLMTQYGVNDVTKLPPAQYGAFATALRGLGAAL